MKMANGKTDIVDAEVIDSAAPTLGTSALQALTKAEIDVQITTAKAYPRSITKFVEEARLMATLDQETAGRMYYRLKRRGKDGVKIIEGPSIRLAEVAVAAWGHTFVASRPVAVEDTVVRCQGMAWDMEKNNRRVFEITRRITDSNGRRYSEDMIVVTQQAASQIAARNAVFGVIPRVYVDHLVKQCKAVFIGQNTSITDKRKAAIEEYAKLGVKKPDVLKIAGREGIDDLTIDDLIDLKGLLTAIEEGQTTIKEVLAAAYDDGGQATVTPDTLTTEALTKGAAVEAEDDAKPPTKPAQAPVEPTQTAPKAPTPAPKPAPKPAPAAPVREVKAAPRPAPVQKTIPIPIEIEDTDPVEASEPEVPEDTDVSDLFRE